MSPGFHLPLPPFLQNYRRRQSSHPPPQPPLSPPPPPPPPSVRWVTRPDTALPPTYDQTWDTVRNNDVWPFFVRSTESNFEAHAVENILHEPNWFLALELDEPSAIEKLWTNVVPLERDPNYHNKHWSLRFLRYGRREADHGQIVPSKFAGMIVCEVIFTILIERPFESMPYRSPDYILNWFANRRTFEEDSPESLELDSAAKSVFHQSPAMDNIVRNRRIRKEALDYLMRNGSIGRLHYDPDVFCSWLTNDLRLLTASRSGGRRYFPPSS